MYVAVSLSHQGQLDIRCLLNDLKLRVLYLQLLKNIWSWFYITGESIVVHLDERAVNEFATKSDSYLLNLLLSTPISL